MSQKTPKLFDETAQKHFEVDVRNIKPLPEDRGSGGNIRTDYGDIDELAQSIETNGIIMPLRAYRDKTTDNGWIAIDGHRRLRAAMKLVEEKNIKICAKVIVVDARYISDEQMIYDMVLTNSGKPLSMVEMSEAVRRLVAYKHPIKEIAAKFGKPVTFIKNLEQFSNAPRRIKEMVSGKDISYSLVNKIFKESSDFQDAIKTIEVAAGLAKESVTSGAPKKITPKHISAATNKVDSFKELQRVFRNAVGKQKVATNVELLDFATKLVNNNLDAKTIESLLYQ